VLALQGYYTLTRYGAAESLGLLVALSLVRELGPVVTALLFAGRAGTSLTAEIGLMKAGEQLAAMELMAIDPKQRVLAPRLLGGIIAMPLLAAMFSAVGIFGGYVVGVLMIGIDPGQFWSQMQGGVDVWDDVGNGMIKSLVFGVDLHLRRAVPGLRGQGDAGRRGAGDHPHGGDLVAGRAAAGLRADGGDVLHAALNRFGARAKPGYEDDATGIETLVGLFVLLGFVAIGYLALKAANLAAMTSARPTW
jgi:hypothetical protein